MRIRILLAAGALAVAGCGTGGESLGQPDPATSSTTSAGAEDNPVRPSPSSIPGDRFPASGGSVIGEVPEEIMDSLIVDATERTGADPEGIEVLRAEQVTWNDGSLGCPEPGQVYTQALVEGYHVEMKSGATTLDYRVDHDGWFKLCQPTLPERSTPTTTD